MKYCPSSLFLAVVTMLATSEPPSGSVMARHERFSPLRSAGRMRRLSSSEPKSRSGFMLMPKPPRTP